MSVMNVRKKLIFRFFFLCVLPERRRIKRLKIKIKQASLRTPVLFYGEYKEYEKALLSCFRPGRYEPPR